MSGVIASRLNRPILALVTDCYGAQGGIAQYNRDFIGAAAAMGHRMTVLPRRGGAAPSTPAGVRQLKAARGRAAYALAAAREVLRTRPSAIFCGHLYHAPLAAWLARRAGAKLIVQLHGIELWRRTPARALAAAEHADLVLTVSRDTRRRALSLLRLAPERIAVLNDTVRPQFFPGDRRAAKRRMGLDDAFVILTVARLDAREAYKGHDRIIPLMTQAAALRKGATYLVAGDGDDRARLQRLAYDAGVADKVRFLGPVDDDALPDLYRAADLFAMPSGGEGFGIAFIEAMACGTPAIGLAAGGAGDALGDGALGACVDEANFPAAFLGLVERGGRSGPELASEVQNRFGQAVFRGAVALQIGGLHLAA